MLRRRSQARADVADFLRRLDLKKLQALWRGDVTAQADLEQLAADPTVLAGVRGRYSAFFRSLAGTADGCWGLEDVDLAVLTIPTIASRTDADAAVRLVLEDLGHFATSARPGWAMTCRPGSWMPGGRPAKPGCT